MSLLSKPADWSPSVRSAVHTRPAERELRCLLMSPRKPAWRFTHIDNKKKGLAHEDESAVQQRNEKAMPEMKFEWKVKGFILGFSRKTEPTRDLSSIIYHLSIYPSILPYLYLSASYDAHNICDTQI